MRDDERRPQSGAAPTTTTTIVASQHSPLSPDLTALASRQVSWWDVHEFVAPMLAAIGPIPAAGTPEWCLLPATDARKIMALLDAAQHWVLRVETSQAELAEASRDVAGAADWSAIAQETLQRESALRSGAYIPRAAS